MLAAFPVMGEDVMVTTESYAYLLVEGNDNAVLMEAGKASLQRLGLSLDELTEEKVRSLTAKESDFSDLRFVLDTLGAKDRIDRGRILGNEASMFLGSDIEKRLDSLGLPAHELLVKLKRKNYILLVVDVTQILDGYKSGEAAVARQRLALWLQQAEEKLP
jgi:hypothetical protein